jgi:hypothetical protein
MVKDRPRSELPDLRAGTEIVAENVRAVQTIYVAAMLEELKMFQVVDRLVNLFQLGILTVNRRSAGRSLYKYWRETPLRLSENERRNLYSRVLGIAGSDGATVNRDFNDLWLRFLSSVAAYRRQSEETNLEPGVLATDELGVRRAAVDLARNVSLYGAGIALYAALDLQTQIETSIKLLSDPEIKSAYGAGDTWQVIDQVATIDLGGAANANRFRTMANSGSTIISWLATNVSKLRPNAQRAILRIKRSTNVPTNLKEFQFSAKSTDSELVNACEHWLAVNSVTDGQIGQHSRPWSSARGTEK